MHKMIIIRVLDDFFSLKTSFALIITLLKFKKRSKIKSKYLDLFMKRLPLANDQGEDRLLCMQVRQISPTSFSHLQRHQESCKASCSTTLWFQAPTMLFL